MLMAHIVLITSEMAGRINVTCELARRLEAAGHAATIASPADIGERVAALGATYVPLAARAESTAAATNPETPSPHPLARFVALTKRLADMRSAPTRREAAVDALDPEGCLTAAMQPRPDLFLVDIELPVHIMAAYSSGVPTALWTTMLSLWKRPGLPPLGSSIIAGRGWQGGRLGLELAWLRFRTWKWLRIQRLRITRLGTDQISVLRRVAERLGFPFRATTDLWQWLIPCVYPPLPTLSFNAFSLEFPHEPHPSFRYVGPMLNPDRHKPVGVAEEAYRGRLDEILRRRRTDAQRRLIYCSFGAWHKGNDLDLIGRVVSAAASRPEWELVIGLGGRLEPNDLGDLPANVHAFRWAPQMEILRHADAAVHHAGISSLNECIAFGVPMVVYPFAFLDQPGNAARVAYHGLGEVGDRSRDSAELIQQRLDRVLGDSKATDRLAALRDHQRAYEHDNVAIAVIAGLLSGPTS